MISRRAFIEKLGGTCKNWNWSWSFVNHENRWVIFGAWENENTNVGDLIFTNDWERNNVRKNPGFKQSREHISLIEDDGYALFTFPMVRDEAYPGNDRSTAKIKSFTPRIKQRNLRHIDGSWYATEYSHDQDSPDVDKITTGKFAEGHRTEVSAVRYERDSEARNLCIAKYGFDCTVCGVNLRDVYGEIAKNFIHVHHLVPISEMGGNYEINPIKDLRPVCPNCHSIIHRRKPILTIDEMRTLMARNRVSKAQ